MINLGKFFWQVTKMADFRRPTGISWYRNIILKGHLIEIKVIDTEIIDFHCQDGNLVVQNWFIKSNDLIICVSPIICILTLRDNVHLPILRDSYLLNLIFTDTVGALSGIAVIQSDPSLHLYLVAHF